jgi:hypothetical protein
MTKYDKLMDVIKDHLYAYYISGQQNDGWDEADAKESSHMILTAVEEYQSSPSFHQWRASD